MTAWEALYRYTNPDIPEGTPGRSWVNKLPVAYFDKNGVGWVSAAGHQKIPGHLRPANEVHFAGWEFRGYYPVRRVIGAIPGGGWTAMYEDGGGEDGKETYSSLLAAWLIYDDGEIKPIDSGADGYSDDPTTMTNFVRLVEPGTDAKRIAELEVELARARNEANRKAQDLLDSHLAEYEKHIVEQRAALTVAAELLHRLAGPGPCDVDNDGACQGHQGFANGYLEPCPHPLARQFVEAWRAVQAEGSGS